MKFRTMVEMKIYGIVEVELAADATDADITHAMLSETIDNQHKMTSDFDIDWDRMERIPQ